MLTLVRVLVLTCPLPQPSSPPVLLSVSLGCRGLGQCWGTPGSIQAHRAEAREEEVVIAHNNHLGHSRSVCLPTERQWEMGWGKLSITGTEGPDLGEIVPSLQVSAGRGWGALDNVWVGQGHLEPP